MATNETNRSTRGGSFAAKKRTPEQKAAGRKEASKPKGSERSGWQQFLFGSSTSAEKAQARETAGQQRQQRTNPANPNARGVGLNAGTRHTNVPGIKASIDRNELAAKEQRLAQAREKSAAFMQRQDEMWSRVAKTRELTTEEWARLNPEQQKQVQFNGTLLGARDADRADGTTSRTDALRDRVGATDLTREQFASGMTAVRESDLFGKQPLRQGDGVLAPGTERSQFQKRPDLAVGSTTRQKMLDQISQGVTAYFNQTGGTFGDSSATALNAILGKTSVSTGTPETDQYLKEIFENSARSSLWQANSYDDLMSALGEVQISPQVFAQYAGERAAESERTGVPLIADTGDALDVATYRSLLGLKEN